MANKELQHNIRLGIFVIAGAVLLIVGLYFIGNNRNMFSRSFRLATVFYDVNGLTEGNNVRYSGIDVGTVEKIRIISDSSVRVEMLIDESIKPYIRKNSVAAVGTDGLMGNKLINITPGNPDAPLVGENDTISSLRAVNTDEMLRTLDLTNQNIAVISSNLKEITENVNKSRGTLYTVLMDTMLAQRVNQSLFNITRLTDNLSETSEQLSSMVSDVRGGKGTLGLLLTDSLFPADLRVTISRFKDGSEQFSQTMNELKDVIAQVNSGKGTVGGLVKDSAMAGNLKRTLINLESSSQKLNEDLEALKHSVFLRGYFKKEVKKAKK